MDIDTSEVIAGMNTKWNALGFYPGLVGGHCIGVDPYYFTYRAEQLGYHSQIILSGRQVNDGMGVFGNRRGGQRDDSRGTGAVKVKGCHNGNHV